MKFYNLTTAWVVGVISVVIIVAGIIFTTFVSSRNSKFISNLTPIVKEKGINLKVEYAYNEHGIYILNSKYFLNSSSNIIENDFGLAKDPAIWRLFEFIPSIADISAPFEILKKENNDTIELIKNNRKIQILLKPYDIK